MSRRHASVFSYTSVLTKSACWVGMKNRSIKRYVTGLKHLIISVKGLQQSLPLSLKVSDAYWYSEPQNAMLLRLAATRPVLCGFVGFLQQTWSGTWRKACVGFSHPFFFCTFIEKKKEIKNSRRGWSLCQNKVRTSLLPLALMRGKVALVSVVIGSEPTGVFPPFLLNRKSTLDDVIA